MQATPPRPIATTMQQDPEAKQWRPVYFTSIPTRHAFSSESDVGASIVSQLESEDSKLAALLGLEITDVATQRSNGKLRPDTTVNSNSETGEAEATIELALEPLDRDHVQRSILNSIDNGAKIIVIIAPLVSPAILDLLQPYARKVHITINVLALHSFLGPCTGGMRYHLAPVYGVSATMPRSLASRICCGWCSIASWTWVTNRSLTSACSRLAVSRSILTGPGTACTRAAGHDHQPPTATKADGTSARTIFNRILRAKDQIEHVVDGELNWGGMRDSSAGNILSLRVDYGDTIDARNDVMGNAACTRLARAYISVHVATSTHI